MISALAARRAATASSSTPATPEPVIQQKRKDPPPSASPRQSSESSAPTSAKRQKRTGTSTSSKPVSSSQPKPPSVSAQARSSQASVVPAKSGAQNADDYAPRSFSPSRMLDDSSDDDTQVPRPSTSRLPPPEEDLMDVALSTFVPVLGQNMFQLQSTDVDTLGLQTPSCLFVMQPGETMSLVGVTTLRLLQGTISLDGVTLKPSTVAHRVFAPISNALPCIRSLSVDKPATKIPITLGQHIPPNCIAFILSELHTGVSGLSEVCRRFDDIFAPRRDPCLPLPIQGISLVERASRRLQPFVLPRSWELVLDRLEQSTINSLTDTATPFAPIILIKGPKRSGKSTLARTLLNRLVTRYRRVAFLECDVGQSEFTPAGMVSLHVVDTPAFGPPFTHVARRPIVAHWTGATTARTDPAHYLACVAACVQTYFVDVQHSFEDEEGEDEGDRITDVVPLVVNTHGWNKGLGADLTIKIQEMVGATDIVDFDPEAIDPVPSTARLHTVSPVDSSLNATYTAADFRVLNIMSYFHSTGDERWDTSLPLCAVPPWEVRSEALDAVILACPGGEDVPSSELATALNGGIVALVSVEPGAIDIPDSNNQSLLPYIQATAVPNPLLSRCLGLGLIRHASADSLHLLTPVPPVDLAQCRIFVKGELELPVVGWLDHRAVDGRIAGVPRDGVPYLQWDAGDGVGATRRKVRRNLMRWGQRAV